jgi:toxin ParE1/3/4
MRVVFARKATSDIIEIGEYIALDSLERAASFVEKLYAQAEGIATMPNAFPLAPGQERHGFRRRAYGRYLIFYTVTNGTIRILRILHGARDYGRLFETED